MTAELFVEGSVVHRIVWRRGRLVLLDHPDPTGELALVALGADRCLCFDVLDAWRTRPREVVSQAREWSGLGTPRPQVGLTTTHASALQAQARAQLIAGASGAAAAQQARLLRRQRRPGFAGSMSAPGAPGRPNVSLPAGLPREIADRIERQLCDQMLALLPPALVERMTLGVLVREHRAGEPGTILPLLDMRAHVAVALNRCVRSWGPHRRPPTVDLDLWVTDRQAPDVVGLVERDLGFVVAVLPERWLLAVHARGLALVDDCFVLDAHLDRANAGHVIAARLERGTPSGWTPVQLSSPVHRTPTGIWHLTPPPPTRVA